MTSKLPEIPKEVIDASILPFATHEFLFVNKYYYSQSLGVIVDNSTDLIPLLVQFIEKKNLTAVETILKKPQLNPSAEQNYAIRKAVDIDFLAAIKILLQDPRFNPDPMPWNEDFKITLISYCVEYGSMQALDLLLACPLIDPSENYNRAVCTAAACNDVHKVQRLIADPRVDPSVPVDFDQRTELPGIYSNQALCIAATHGYVEITKLLISDPRVDPTEGLARAVKENQVEIVELLLADSRAEPKDWHLEYACSWGHEGVVRAYLADGRININGNKGEVLRCACRYKRLSIISILLDQPSIDVRFIMPNLKYYDVEVQNLFPKYAQKQEVN